MRLIISLPTADPAKGGGRFGRRPSLRGQSGLSPAKQTPTCISDRKIQVLRPKQTQNSAPIGGNKSRKYEVHFLEKTSDGRHVVLTESVFLHHQKTEHISDAQTNRKTYQVLALEKLRMSPSQAKCGTYALKTKPNKKL